MEKYLELERARKERFLHGDKLLLPGEDLDGNIHGTVIEARKLKEQQVKLFLGLDWETFFNE